MVEDMNSFCICTHWDWRSFAIRVLTVLLGCGHIGQCQVTAVTEGFSVTGSYSSQGGLMEQVQLSNNDTDWIVSGFSFSECCMHNIILDGMTEAFPYWLELDEGNIFADPVFVPGDGFYRVNNISPCTDAFDGVDVTEDFFGNPRTYKSDIGAHEND